MTDESPPAPIGPTYRRSEKLGNLMKALARSMAATGPALHDSENPHFKSTYASLAACHAVCIHPLTENGLTFTMLPDVTPQVVRVTGLLYHGETEEWLESTITIPHDGDAHSIGSAETYAKRYLYCMVGVVADADDDGNGAVGRPAPPKQRQPPTPKAEPVKEAPRPISKPAAAKPASVPPPANDGPIMTDAIVARIRALFRELNYPTVDATQKIVAVTGVDRDHMRQPHAEKLLAVLEAEARERKAS